MLTPDPTGGRPTSDARTLVGALVAGKYRLRRVLGRGGMGTVYKAENVTIGRTVAVKVLHGHLADDGVTVARFQREARAAASIGHEHIIDVLDLGVEPSGAPFMVMEYVRGRSIARALKEDGPFPAARAARVAGQVLSGLAAAHRVGIIHRDLKPENVLLSVRRGRPDFVTLFDFGVAVFVDAAQDQTGPHDLTPVGRAMGTPAYVSPEQILGGRVRDARVDLYAVGVLIFEMLTGRVPFVAPSFPELCHAITDHEPPPFAQFGVRVPPGLEGLVRRALHKQPDARFQTAEAMAHALVPFGAEPLQPESDDTTDTLTLELRELRAREALLGHASPKTLPPGSTSMIRGAALLGLLEFVQQTVGIERYEQLLRDDRELLQAVTAGIDPDAWYAGGFIQLIERIDREQGRGDRRLVAEAGRYLARQVFTQRERDRLLRTLTPELFWSLLPELWTRYFAVGDARVAKVGRGYGRLEVGGVPDALLARSVAIAGFLDEALRMAGARAVDVRLAAASALGDSFDVFEATWSS